MQTFIDPIRTKISKLAARPARYLARIHVDVRINLPIFGP